MGKCPTVAEVDFGDGPVQIRCTQTGPHKQCRTEVFIFDRDQLIPEGGAVRHNVFEQTDQKGD